MSMVFDLQIPSGPKLVFLALADRADDKGHCYPSQKDLSRKSTMSVRSVQTHLNWLEEKGYIKRTERRRNDGYRTSDDYQIIKREDVSHETLTHENISPEKSSHENISDENIDGSQAKNLQGYINPPSEALSESSKEPSGERKKTDFEKFWDAYPKKTAQGTARRSFANAITFQAADPAQIIRAAENFARKQREEGTEEKFIKAPATWLDGECYADPDLQAEPPKPVDMTGQPGWKRDIASAIGPHILNLLLDADRDGETLIVAKQIGASILRQQHEHVLRRLGITEIKHRGTP